MGPLPVPVQKTAPLGRPLVPTWPILRLTCVIVIFEGRGIAPPENLPRPIPFREWKFPGCAHWYLGEEIPANESHLGWLWGNHPVPLSWLRRNPPYSIACRAITALKVRACVCTVRPKKGTHCAERAPGSPRVQKINYIHSRGQQMWSNRILKVRKQLLYTVASFVVYDLNTCRLVRPLSHTKVNANGCACLHVFILCRTTG